MEAFHSGEGPPGTDSCPASSHCCGRLGREAGAGCWTDCAAGCETGKGALLRAVQLRTQSLTSRRWPSHHLPRQQTKQKTGTPADGPGGRPGGLGGRREGERGPQGAVHPGGRGGEQAVHRSPPLRPPRGRAAGGPARHINCTRGGGSGRSLAKAFPLLLPAGMREVLKRGEIHLLAK